MVVRLITVVVIIIIIVIRAAIAAVPIIDFGLGTAGAVILMEYLI